MMRALLSFVLLLIPFSLSAQDEAVQPGPRTVRGTGPDERTAVENALIEALHQAIGMVSTDETMTRKVTLMRGSLHGALWSAADGSASAGEQVSTAVRDGVRASTKGIIESYRIVGRGKDGGEVWVEVEAKIAAFDRAHLRDGPFTVVVLPVVSVTGTYLRQIDGQSDKIELDLGPTASHFGEVLRRHFVQSRKVEVLERSDLAGIDAELQLLMSGKASSKETMRLQQQLVADYVLQVRIERAQVTAESIDLQGLGFSKKQGFDVAVGYKLLETATGVIADQRSVRKSQPMESAGKAANSPEADPSGLLGYAFAEMQQQISDAVLDKLSPLKVAKVSAAGGAEAGTQVWLNQGGARFAEGDLFDVYTVGEQVVDPDTGEVLESGEERVATVRIAEVRDRVCIGNVVTGNGGKVQRGAVVRRHR